MSRIWNKPVLMQDWVKVSLDWDIISFSWPKGELKISYLTDHVSVEIEEWTLKVTALTEEKKSKAFQWLTRTLIYNSIVWVTKWFESKIQIIGVWYNAQVQGTTLVLNLWFSHKVELPIDEWLTVTPDKKEKNVLIIGGIDKQKIWQFCSKIRKFRPPEPYKWKWIRFYGEYVKRKAWKSAKK